MSFQYPRGTTAAVPVGTAIAAAAAVLLALAGDAPLAALAVGPAVVAVAGWTLLAHGRRPVPGAVRLGLVLFGAFAGWTLASMAWSPAPGAAWSDGNRCLVYGAALVTACLAPGMGARLAGAATLVVAVWGACAVGVLVLSARAGALDELFVEGRLTAPTGYANAAAAFWLLGAWPALHVAADRARATAVRAAALGVGTLLLGMAALPQSRGAVLGAAAGLAVLLAVSPRRGTAALAAGVAGAAVAACWGPIGEVASAASPEALEDRLSSVRIALAAAVLATGAAWAGLLALRRRGVRPPVARPPLRGRAMTVLAIAAVVAGVAAASADPLAWARGHWKDFTSSSYASVDRQEERLGGSLASGRHDYYRVAVGMLGRDPIAGAGAGAFAGRYLLDRRTREAPEDPHSLLFGTLAHLGVVGAALLAAALACLTRAALAAGRRRPEPEALASAALLAGVAGWAAQALVDRFWSVPGLTLLALLALGAVAAGGGGAGGGTPRRRRSGRIAVSVLAVAAVASVAAPASAAWLVERDAGRHGHVDFAGLRLATRLDPLSARPSLVLAVAARRSGRLPLAATALDQARRREPGAWLVFFERGLLAATRGDRAAAARDLRRSAVLNPRQPVVGSALRTVLAGDRVDATAVERSLSPVSRPAETAVFEPVEAPAFRLPPFKPPPGT